MKSAREFWTGVERAPRDARTRQVFAFNWGVAGVGFAMLGWEDVAGGRTLCFGRIVWRTRGISEPPATSSAEPQCEYFGPGDDAGEIQGEMLDAVRKRGAHVTDVEKIIKPTVEGAAWGKRNVDMFKTEKGV